MTWRTAPSRTHCSSPRGNIHQLNITCARSPAQTTVGFPATECNSGRKDSDHVILRVLRDGSLFVSRVMTRCSSRVPRANRPVDSELHSTHTARKTQGVRRAARRQRDSAGRRSSKRVGGTLSCGRRARRAAAIERHASRRPIPSVLRRHSAGGSGPFDQRDNVVLYSRRPPEDATPANCKRRQLAHLAVVRE